MIQTFEARLGQLEPIQNFILGFADQSLESTCKDIKLAVEEVVVNIINHGYQQGKGWIEVKCELLPKSNQLIIHFKDEGIPFNPVDYLTKPTEETEGGLGIQLYKQLMDKVIYSRSSKSNNLTLIKYLELTSICG